MMDNDYGSLLKKDRPCSNHWRIDDGVWMLCAADECRVWEKPSRLDSG